MYSSPTNSDQHTYTLEEDDTIIQNIQRSINQLEQCSEQAQAKLDYQNSLIVIHSELTREFALPKTIDVETEKSLIRQSDHEQAKRRAELHLMQFKEAERRCANQVQRMSGLETRLAIAETIWAEQMRINREMADVSIRVLREHKERECRRILALKDVNGRFNSITKELEQYRCKCAQQEQSIIQLREETNALNLERSSLIQHSNKLEAEKNNLLLEKDQFTVKENAFQTRLTERDELVDQLRQREKQLAEQLRTNQIEIVKLKEDCDKRDLELLCSRKEHETLLATKEGEMEQLAESNKNRAVIALKANYQKEIEQRDQEIQKICKRFKDALHEAALETQKLGAERQQYYDNWRRLKEGRAAYEQRLKAKMRREAVKNCVNFVDGLGNDQASSDNPPNILEPIENVAQRALDQLGADSGLS